MSPRAPDTCSQKPSSNRTRDEKISIAQAAADTVKPFYDSKTGKLTSARSNCVRWRFRVTLTLPSATSDMDDSATPLVYTALARQDFIAGAQSNKFVVDAIRARSDANPGFVYKCVLNIHPE
jgi:hypothetical protein